jgi:hypothetical protein
MWFKHLAPTSWETRAGPSGHRGEGYAPSPRRFAAMWICQSGPGAPFSRDRRTKWNGRTEAPPARDQLPRRSRRRISASGRGTGNYCITNKTAARTWTGTCSNPAVRSSPWPCPTQIYFRANREQLGRRSARDSPSPCGWAGGPVTIELRVLETTETDGELRGGGRSASLPRPTHRPGGLIPRTPRRSRGAGIRPPRSRGYGHGIFSRMQKDGTGIGKCDTARGEVSPLKFSEGLVGRGTLFQKVPSLPAGGVPEVTMADENFRAS